MGGEGGGGFNTQTLIMMINAHGQYITFWLFIRLPVFTQANKINELSFDFNLQIIYFLEYQSFVCPSSKQEFFFDVIRIYSEVKIQTVSLCYSVKMTF